MRGPTFEATGWRSFSTPLARVEARMSGPQCARVFVIDGPNLSAWVTRSTRTGRRRGRRFPRTQRAFTSDPSEAPVWATPISMSPHGRAVEPKRRPRMRNATVVGSGDDGLQHGDTASTAVGG